MSPLYVAEMPKESPALMEPRAEQQSWGCSIHLRAGAIFRVSTAGSTSCHYRDFSGITASNSNEVAIQPITLEGLLQNVRETRSPDKLDELEEQLSELAAGNPKVLLHVFRSSVEPPHVRAAALRALINSVPRAAAELILQALRDPEARVREVATEGASEFRSDPAVAEELRRIEAKDPSDVIRAIAADALSTT